MMRSVAEHRDAILAAVAPLAPVALPISACRGLVTVADVVAEVDLPGFNNSAMDGYAVRAADVTTARPGAPVSLRVIGEVAAGGDGAAYDVGVGEAVRIMTGAMMPAGADAVVMVERTDGGTEVVAIEDAAPVGQSIRPAGEDVRAGTVVVPAGTVVNPRVVALAAATGHGTLAVRPRPRVAVLSTGDELIPPGMPLRPGQIHESNAPMLAACVEALGAEVVRVASVSDDADALIATLGELVASCDAVVTTGGVSMGAYDVVKAALRDRGVEFVQVAMQPGKPQGFGAFDGVPVFALPGNPVSAFVSFEMFVAPALDTMMGRSHERRVVTGVMGHALDSPAGRTQIARAVTRRAGSTWLVDPVVGQGSHFVHDLVRANSLVIVPAESTRLVEGDPVEVWLLDGVHDH
ncbi:molybdopterin molybdotransferase MoeA [Nostocoides jenkinsii]|uniref:Molybdopterin molybdenumtransferase n=1 Tax=Nostocoides jenkinsii Ben 74 TaxID=1193518 RepID=A0A077MFP6_9MICO|nr:gephyrin-like molybdotransferase Glp [Tetrasphaera jenkinsii]CCI54048.1 Molybdopterin molybdenumtransferase 2 [Tetrasphaera jenkinsii Ben 74]